jgi:hypothetical protein
VATTGEAATVRFRWPVTVSSYARLVDQRSNEGFRPSTRLRAALVADLVMNDVDERGDVWLSEPLREEHEWTEHFGRQLGITWMYGDGGVHDTLMLILPEVDRLIRTWPPTRDLKVCRELAHEATKHLSAVELVGTLLAGPSSWRQAKVESGCRVDRLRNHLQPMLEKLLAAELHRVLDQWERWDIRELKSRRREALETARTRNEAEAAQPRTPYRRPTGRDRLDRLEPPYQPPGRT